MYVYQILTPLKYKIYIRSTFSGSCRNWVVMGPKLHMCQFKSFEVKQNILTNRVKHYMICCYFNSPLYINLNEFYVDIRKRKKLSLF